MYLATLEFLMTVNMTIVVFCDMMTYILVNGYQLLQEYATTSFRIKYQATEAARSFKPAVTIYQTTRRHT
jgi:hypothetical protein